MMRRSAWLVFAAGAVFTNLASAVGLGELKLNSALNQPLNAEIKLLNTGDLSKNELLPNLASHEDFARAGVERVFFLTGIKFDVEFKNGGDVVINLKTDKIVREPFLNFLVEIHWPNGRILREYTVLLDPPVFSEAPPPAVTQAAVSKPAPAPAPTPRAVAATPTRAQPQSQSAPVTTRSAPSASQGGDKVVIKKNDTLWGIARDNRPDSALSIRQTMMAIQRENPHAFINNNINLIRAGQVLRVPSASEIRSISSGEAIAETRRQNEEWREKKVVASASEDDDYAIAPAVSETSDDDRGILKLVGDDFAEEEDPLASTAAGAAAEGDDAVASEGGYGLSRADDESATVSAADSASDSGIATAKVDELESQVEDLKRLLALKDQQLALLQASAANDADGSAARAESAGTPEEAGAEDSSAKSEGGLLALITENPIYIGIAILVFLAIMVIFGAMSRRRTEDDEYPIGLQSEIAESESDVELPDDLVEELDNDVAGLGAADSEPEEEVFEEAAAEVDDEAETVRKAIEEAEIYIAYGRAERAIEILQPAIDEYPNNTQLVLKMAEISIATDDAAGLTAQEAKLQEIGDSEAIQRLQGLKRDAQQAADDSALEAEAETEAEIEAGEFTAEEAPELDNDDDVLAGADALDDLDTLDASENATPDNVVEFESAASAAQTEAAEPVEFSLDDTDAETALESDELDEIAADLDDTADAAADELEMVDEDAEASDEDFLGDTDESATKLELARAYIDMADKDAAEDILNEVIEEGSDEQKQKARQLLEGLG